MILYLVTISCQQKLIEVSQSDLHEVIMWLKMNINSLHIYHYSYETTGKYNQLHFHAIAGMTGMWKPFTQWGEAPYTKTYRIQWSKIADYPGALDYVYKDTNNNPSIQDQILILNHYKHNYFNMTTQSFQQLTTINSTIA